MNHRVTVRDIACAAQVSIGTVSRVLNNQAHVARETREHVLSVARTLGYRPSALVGKQATDSIREIGFVFNPVNPGTVATTSPYWSRILAGCEHEAARHEAQITYRSLRTLQQNGQRLRTAVEQMGMDALLLVGPADVGVIDELYSTRLPLVLVDHYHPAIPVSALTFDMFSGGRMATRYLIERGHCEIAFISGPSLDSSKPFHTIYTVEMRYHGYRTALLDAGLEVLDSLIEPSNLTPEGGYQACRRLLERGVSFSAVCCANDSVAIGALKALNEAGLTVPGDVSVIGFGDYLDVAEQLTPALTTMHTDLEMLGRMAVRRLISDRDMLLEEPTLMLLPVRLVERGSVGERRQVRGEP